MKQNQIHGTLLHVSIHSVREVAQLELSVGGEAVREEASAGRVRMLMLSGGDRESRFTLAGP